MFLEPLGLIALLGVPAVVALHLLRRRFQPRVVSALFLWDTRDQSPTAGPRRERLRQTASLWLESLAALLLALLFAGLKGCAGTDAQHLVVVIDGSASMSAVTANGDLRQRAIDEATRRIDGLPRGSRVTLIRSGPQPEMLAGPGAETSLARDTLRSYRGDQPRHAREPTLDLARQIAGERAITFLTDELPDDAPPDIEWIALGEPTANNAITHVARSLTEDGERAYVTVTAFRGQPAEVRLAVLAGEVELATRTLSLGPDTPKAVTFELPPNTGTLEVRIDDDALAIDNRAWLAAPPDRTLKLFTDLEDEVRRELGLAGDGDEEPWERLSRPAGRTSEVAGADLLIGDAENSRGVSLRFEVDAEARRDLIGPFLIDKRHPLLDGVTLDGVVWSVAEDHVLAGAPLISAGNLPLLTEVLIGDRPSYRINYDPSRSTMHRSPDWPILLANLAAIAREQIEGPTRTTLTVGETFTCRSSDEGRYVLAGDDLHLEYQARTTLTVDAPSLPGRYRLSRDDQPLGEIAVNFVDPTESDLRDLAAGSFAAEAPPPTIEASLVGLDLALLSAVVALLLLDWLLLHRGRVG